MQASVRSGYFDLENGGIQQPRTKEDDSMSDADERSDAMRGSVGFREFQRDCRLCGIDGGDSPAALAAFMYGMRFRNNHPDVDAMLDDIGACLAQIDPFSDKCLVAMNTPERRKAHKSLSQLRQSLAD
jgi:hypothetical protein